MRSRIRIAQIKVVPEKGKLEANHQRLQDVLRQVAPTKPDVVITPECFLDGYVSTERHVTAASILKYAVAPSSHYVKSVSRWARAHSSWFVLGCTRPADDGSCNSAFVFNRVGTIVGVYDKVHCQTHDRKYVAGQSLPVFESDFGPFGIMICADRRWPETVRTLALRGARVIFNPTYGIHDERNLAMVRTRSYESEVYIAFTHPKQSLVTRPDFGITINETSEDVEFAVSEIELSEVDRIRSGRSAHLKDRRPDVYEGGI